MRPSVCRGCLACLLRLLNFLQSFVGVSVALYAVWVLNLCLRRGLGPDVEGLPAPWFVCASMGVGVVLCLISFMGHVATEVTSGCCFCFYAVLTTVLILLEAALVGGLVFDKNWEADLPHDSTGELQKLRLFIEDNIDIFKWVAVTVVVIQALSFLLALILRAMIPSQRMDYDSDEDFIVIRRPLLNPPGGPTYASPSVDSQGFHTDTWSSRMRQKYGLNQHEFAYSTVDPKASMSMNSSNDDQRLCSVL